MVKLLVNSNIMPISLPVEVRSLVDGAELEVAKPGAGLGAVAAEGLGACLGCLGDAGSG